MCDQSTACNRTGTYGQGRAPLITPDLIKHTHDCHGSTMSNGDYHLETHSLSLTCIQFHTLKVTPLTNLTVVTVYGLCYCNSNAWGWRNVESSAQAVSLFSRIDKSPEVCRRNNNWLKRKRNKKKAYSN